MESLPVIRGSILRYDEVNDIGWQRHEIFGKKVIKYPDTTVPVISTKDLAQSISQDPIRKVKPTGFVADVPC